MKLKKLFMTLLLALGIGASAIGVGTAVVTQQNKPMEIAEAANVTGGTTLYLKPNSNWLQANARFAMYLCNGTSNDHWYSMYEVGSSGIYSATVDKGETHKNVIFCRMNPNNQTNDWGQKWNQTSDLDWAGGTSNLYTIKKGTWDGSGSSWSTFDKTKLTYYLVGSCNSWSTNNDFKFSYNSSTDAYELIKELDGGTEFKIYDGDWDSWNVGYSKFKSNSLIKENNSNVKLTASVKQYYKISIPFGSDKMTVEKLDDKYFVEKFVNDYMHPEIEYNSDPTLEVNQKMDCKNESWYSNAKSAFNGLTSAQKELFCTDADYANAVARLQAWAIANNETFNSTDYSFTAKTNANLAILQVAKDNSGAILIVFMSLISLAAVGGYFFLNKKRKDQ